MEKFAEKLKELRLERGLTIKQLAEETNLSRSTICRWENMQSEIGLTGLVILSKYFGVSVDYLLGLED